MSVSWNRISQASFRSLFTYIFYILRVGPAGCSSVCLWCSWRSSSLKRLEMMNCRRDCLPGLSWVPVASLVVWETFAFAFLLSLPSGLWRPLGMCCCRQGVASPHCGMKAASARYRWYSASLQTTGTDSASPSLLCPKTKRAGLSAPASSARWEEFLFRHVLT